MLGYIVIGIFAALIAGWLYFHTQPDLTRKAKFLLAGLRFISVTAILLLLISPILYFKDRDLIRPKIISLFDASGSMKLSSGNRTKEAFVMEKAQALIGKFSGLGYETQEYRFANGLGGDPSSSLLGPSLASLAEQVDFANLAGIVLASDGWLRDEDLSIITRLGVPFYVVADTGRVEYPDLVMLRTQNNRFAYRNEATALRAEVQALNWSGTALVKLYLGNNVHATQSVNLQAGQSSNVDFTLRLPRTGLVSYRMEISAPGIRERTVSNNSYPGAIEVLADKERIILISDSPAWDNKFIMDVIAANNRWEAEHYSLRGGRLFMGDESINSISGDNVAGLVLINNGNLQLSEATTAFIRQLHQRGVGILWQGSPVRELQAILPIQASNITNSYSGFLTWLPAAGAFPMLSLPEGEAGRIPPVDYYYVTSTRTSQTLVKINNPQNSPAIVVSQSGTAGKVLAFAFLNLWKWQMQGSKDAYKQLINNCLTWLSNRTEGNFQAIYKNSYMLGEEIVIRLRADDSIRQSRLDLNPRIRILDAQNKEVFADYLSQDGDEYKIKASLEDAGDYRFEIKDTASGEQAGGSFSLSSQSIEDRDYDYNLPLLAWMASESGGRLISSDYSPMPAQTEERIRTREIAIYKKWYLISLFILCFCLELFFRRRWGLL